MEFRIVQLPGDPESSQDPAEHENIVIPRYFGNFSLSFAKT